MRQAQAARWAIQLESHTFSEEFVKYGNQLLQSKACALQRVINDTSQATIQDISAIMFHDDTKRRARSAPAYSNVAGYDSDEMLPSTELSADRAASDYESAGDGDGAGAPVTTRRSPRFVTAGAGPANADRSDNDSVTDVDENDTMIA